MKTKITFLILLTITTCNLFGQVNDTLKTEKDLKSIVLEEIQTGLDAKSKNLKQTVSDIDSRVDDLDKAITNSKSAVEKANKLLTRVQELEKRQVAVDENELNIFQANYQSAIINLISMDREIKPLKLFNTTKDFFENLAETSNPMSYQEFDTWYVEFKKYIDRQKSKEAGIAVLSNLLDLTGELTKGAPFSGPITQPLFTSISSFINSLGNSKKELREQSERMFILAAKLSQFTHDKDLIEHEWISITNELSELQKHYDNVLKENLLLLSIDTLAFQNKYVKENDANKRLNFMLEIKQKAADYVLKTKNINSKDWKEIVYFEMMDVQSLKLRFGRITFSISENIDRYRILITKYKSDPQIGSKVTTLETKLNNLKETFDSTFEPIEYLNSATRMYKIH